MVDSETLTNRAKRSLSCSEFTIEVYHPLRPAPTDHFFQEISFIGDEQTSPTKQLVLSAPQLSRQRGYSTTLSPMSPELIAEVLHNEDDIIYLDLLENQFDDDNDDDDEEIKTQELPTIREDDLKISFEMVMRRMIMSSSGPVTYPCQISIQPNKEIIIEQPNLDLILLINLRETSPNSLGTTIQSFLRFLSEKDRLSLFTTQSPFAKRFPFRIMDEPTKSQFVHAFSELYDNHKIKNASVSLDQAFDGAMKALQNRRYQNHVASVLIITDTPEEINVENFKNKAKQLSLPPIVNVFGMGQKHDPIKLQEVCDYFEGDYYYNPNTKVLYESMKGCLSKMRLIQAKKLEITLNAGEDISEIMTIINVYEAKGAGKRTQRDFTFHRNYYSIKNRIDFALEIELSKIDSLCEAKMNSYLLELALSCDPLTKNASLNFKKQLTVKTVTNSSCSISKDVDITTLENFCAIKLSVKILEAARLSMSGQIGDSVRSLLILQKELRSFQIFKSQLIDGMSKIVDWVLNHLQKPSFEEKERIIFFKEMSVQAVHNEEKRGGKV